MWTLRYDTLVRPPLLGVGLAVTSAFSLQARDHNLFVVSSLWMALVFPAAQFKQRRRRKLPLQIDLEPRQTLGHSLNSHAMRDRQTMRSLLFA
jgi:hypothetical protein